MSQAVVNLYRDDDGSEVLVAFVTARGGADVTLDRIRTALAERLPAYMRPSAYEVRQSLPTLVSGKVDRKALARPERIEVEARTLAPAETPSEEALLAAWREALAHPAISVEDDFFEGFGRPFSQGCAHGFAGPRHAVAGVRVDPGPLRRAHHPQARRPASTPARPSGAAAEAKPPEPFHPIPQVRRTLCVIAQTVALIPIFAAAGVQWDLPLPRLYRPGVRYRPGVARCWWRARPLWSCRRWCCCSRSR